MFLKTLRELRHTLALRLTLWYGGIFVGASMLAFAFLFTFMVTVVQERTDDELEDDIEEFVEFMRSGGLERVEAEIIAETQGEEAEESYLRLWTDDSRQLMSSDLDAWPELPVTQSVLDALDDSDEPILQTLELQQREHRTRIVYGTIAPGIVLEIGESLEDDEEFIAVLLKSILIALAVMVLLGGPVGWFMARRALRGVQEITLTAAEIANGALNRRVPVHAQADELDTLANTFNIMVDRIQALINGMREMTDNLAHDLRSPLGRMRAAAEMTLASGGAREDAEVMAATNAEECDRLLEMINTTLDIAEAESGAAHLRLNRVDLVPIIQDAVEIFETIAEDKEIRIVTELPERCGIEIDQPRLQRVIANLLDNALKYTPNGGRVTVKLIDEESRVRLTVEDSGIGIVGTELDRVFERFYRCERSRSERGNGLGLSLARAFVRAHGGDITADSNGVKGSIFTVVLPHKLAHLNVERTGPTPLSMAKDRAASVG